MSTKKSKNSTKAKETPQGLLKKPPPNSIATGKPEQTPGKAITPGDKTQNQINQSEMFSPIVKIDEESIVESQGAKKDATSQETQDIGSA